MQRLTSFGRAAFALLFVFFVSVVQAKEVFTFTAIPDQDETQLQQRFGKVASYLEKELGIEVKYIPVKSYAAAITAFRNNQVQLAWFGGLSGVRARLLVPGSEALAQGYEDQFFKTYLIANHKTGLQAAEKFPENIVGGSFTFGSKGSTSGRLMPEFYIRENLQKSPDDAFRRVGFSGDHSRTISLVQSGAYEVGAVNYKVWERELAEGKIDTSKVQVIWSTPEYPDYQWSIRGDVDKTYGDNFKQRVQQALLGMNSPELLAAFPRQSFVEAENDFYQPIEDTARKIGLLD
ncbi:putative selenate ABC transporter substrate-binding protein [Parendozoicomonas sp. Alg238-R29]|uniref:putative selenate ABC transporter substrate-binding protein n=1 Tax=Parendozoicomonas sp. Alg238-R29 TaxID=2993446 RepID=UPI00248D6AB6|nr:putative selenate ABC transporter substrate-binding protein [Parendozoicomonas sp. Alg238-R29]